jgi:hypothetical protein
MKLARRRTLEKGSYWQLQGEHLWPQRTADPQRILRYDDKFRGLRPPFLCSEAPVLSSKHGQTHRHKIVDATATTEIDIRRRNFPLQWRRRPLVDKAARSSTWQAWRVAEGAGGSYPHDAASLCPQFHKSREVADDPVLAVAEMRDDRASPPVTEPTRHRSWARLANGPSASVRTRPWCSWYRDWRNGVKGSARAGVRDLGRAIYPLVGQICGFWPNSRIFPFSFYFLLTFLSLLISRIQIWIQF